MYDKKSWQQLVDISKFFSIEMLTLGVDDWDTVEDQIKKVIKSVRADPNFRPHGAGLLKDTYSR